MSDFSASSAGTNNQSRKNINISDYVGEMKSQGYKWLVFGRTDRNHLFFKKERGGWYKDILSIGDKEAAKFNAQYIINEKLTMKTETNCTGYGRVAYLELASWAIQKISELENPSIWWQDQ